ncbi:PD-(D/E)XK nuclease family protein [Desulfobacca acetoxidans]
MTIPGAAIKIFPTSAALQDFLLAQSPGALIIVPHMRLAYQVWRRQRLAARAAGRLAWEPLAMTTLSGWWHQLGPQLWLPVQPASYLQRMSCWLQAMAAAPPPEGVEADLAWAAALDEALDLIERYQIPPAAGAYGESTLIAWRRPVIREFLDLLRQKGSITPAALPSYLLQALQSGSLSWPEKILLVGMETPAPVEQEWLTAVARKCPLIQLILVGREDTARYAITLPDRRQEMDWVAAKVLELADQEQIPLHRLAVTAPNLTEYLPELRRIWRELLGPGMTPEGCWYNFSLGDCLAETPIFHAALLPLRFRTYGELREDLAAWLLSPYYQEFSPQQAVILQWDLIWRRSRIAYNWPALRRAASEADRTESESALLSRLDRIISCLPLDPAPAGIWTKRLQAVWEQSGFPGRLSPLEERSYQHLQELLRDLTALEGSSELSGSTLIEWLNLGARQIDLPGEGTQEAGVQILGLLELRGLDFDAVFCMGLNMGVFPPPPRPLPLLTASERVLVLGGTYQGQQQFAEQAYRNLQAVAPRLICTRPLVQQEEEQTPSFLIDQTWRQETCSPLSRPHPAWLRSPAVRVVFQAPASGGAILNKELTSVKLPSEISLSALMTALACPCQFYFSVLLGLQELPEIDSGLPAPERGSALHQVLERFTRRFSQAIQESDHWNEAAALNCLQIVMEEFQSWAKADPHWQAELERWLAPEGGVLREWLQQERQHYEDGWRWLVMEAPFAGLRLPDWPGTIRGRIDRIDWHKEQGLMLWDYKSGNVPKQRDLEEDRSQFQLPGYLLAVQHGLIPTLPRQQARAGIIGLKSSRQDHLRFEDYGLSAGDWRRLLSLKLAAVAKVGKKVQQGDFRPDPSLPPPGKGNSCTYCSFHLLCGYRPEDVAEEDE